MRKNSGIRLLVGNSELFNSYSSSVGAKNDTDLKIITELLKENGKISIKELVLSDKYEDETSILPSLVVFEDNSDIDIEKITVTNDSQDRSLLSWVKSFEKDRGFTRETENTDMERV